MLSIFNYWRKVFINPYNAYLVDEYVPIFKVPFIKTTIELIMPIWPFYNKLIVPLINFIEDNTLTLYWRIVYFYEVYKILFGIWRAALRINKLIFCFF
jgi:hypothetical protein